MANFSFSGTIGHDGGKLILTEDMAEGQDQQLTPAINQTRHLSIKLLKQPIKASENCLDLTNTNLI